MINAYKLQKKMVDKMFYYPIELNAEKITNQDWVSRNLDIRNS